MNSHLYKRINYIFFVLLIHACGGGKSENKAPVTNTNTAPVITAQSFETQLDEPLTFNIIASDKNGDTLSFAITKSTEQGTLSHTGSNTFTYQPVAGQTEPVSFDISVSDSKLTSTATMAINIVDNNPYQVINHQPTQGEQSFAINRPILITFNSVVNFTSMSNSYGCAHSITLINKKTNNCIPIKITIGENKKQLYITPEKNLPTASHFELTVTQNHANFVGTTIAKEYLLNFSTSAQKLVINEFILTDFTSDYRWVELYNGTQKTIDLSQYHISTQSINVDNNQITEQHNFNLPSQLLASGHYFVVQNAHFPSDWKSGFKTTKERYIVQGKERLYWLKSGYIELVETQKNNVIDIVKFGHYDSNDIALSWQGNNISTNDINIVYRRLNSAPQQSNAEQWQLSRFPTIGAINDVLCEHDTDNDGIPDCNEQLNKTYAGLPLHTWGARPNQKDVFIEIDHMKSSDLGIRPQWHALNKVRQVFKANNYHVHFDVGELFESNQDETDKFNLGGGSQVPFSLSTYFKESPQQTSVLSYKSEHFSLARDNIFHYVLFANSQNLDGSFGSSGYAEIEGDDAIITLGNWKLNNNNAQSTNYLVNIQSATLVHELGHNFGLQHGGLDWVNNKPNHISSMNYRYQLSGIPVIGNNEGDRLLQEHHFPNELCQTNEPLINGPNDDFNQFIIGYSHGLSVTLFEDKLDESTGFGHQGSTAIDYNCDGEISAQTIVWDLDRNNWSNDIFKDYNEWEALKLDINIVEKILTPPVEPKLRPRFMHELKPTKALLDAIEQAANQAY